MVDQVFTDSNFKASVLENTQPVVVEFWAEWCGPCKIVEPVLGELAKEYQGKLVVGKINADENQQVAEQFTVMSLPTVMFFKNGQPVQALVGARGKQAYKAEIENLLA